MRVVPPRAPVLLLGLGVLCIYLSGCRSTPAHPLPAGPWALSPVRFPDRQQEVLLTPLTETVETKEWIRRGGGRRLARFESVRTERETGAFQLASAEGVTTVYDGVYDTAADGFAKKPREKDFYAGIVLTRKGDTLVVADTGLPRLRSYVGSTFSPIRDEGLFASLRQGNRADLESAPDLVERAATEHDALGRTLLFRAAQLDDRATVALLLGKGVPADLCNKNAPRRTALAAAIRLGRIEVIDQLIAAGADVNIADDSGARPLHIAGEGCGKYTLVVRRLLAAGADPELPNNAGETPRRRLERAGASGFLPLLDREVARRASASAPISSTTP